MNTAEFTEKYYIDRQGSHSRKWDGEHLKFNRTDLLPLWVADMDFMPPRCIQEAICNYVKANPLGYTMTNPNYIEAVISWYKRRHNCTIISDWLTNAPNVITAIMWCIAAFTKTNDAIAVLSPVYGAFDSSASDAKRQIIAVPMTRNEDNRYAIDYSAFEAAIVKHDVKLFIHCNPHNPVGRVWTEDELKRLGDICIKHNVLIVSDEIHADFVWKGHTHKVFADLGESYAEHCIVCTAPSKTFNIAGLQVSNIFIPNDSLRRRFIKEIDRAGYSQLNTMGIVGCEGAYKVGASWLDELKEYIQDNIQFTIDYVAKYMPKIRVYRPEGTYLMWLDCSQLPLSPKERDEWIINDAKLWLDTGSMFGVDGEDFERINVACPRKILEDGLEAWRRAYEAKGF